jgi:NADPH2:quinone reductase
MRAVRVQELSGPKAIRVDEVPDPKPTDGEVLVDVRAAGVNFPDVLLSYGKYQLKFEPPFIPGIEAAGVVSAVGAGVTELKVGDRVASTTVGAAFAEKIAVPVSTTVKIPAAVSFETAAATLLTYGTSDHALVERGAVKKGETLLVLGAAGGVGLAAVQIGKMLGARVIAAASTPQKVAFCKEHGADEGICYGTEDLKQRIKELTGGEGADVIYDPVGGPYSEQALRGIAWQGRFLVVGFAAGDIPKIPLNLVLLKGCQVMGVIWGMWAMREPQKNRARYEVIFDDVAAGKLKPQVDAALPFAKATEALERIERREVRGKLVLVP